MNSRLLISLASLSFAAGACGSSAVTGGTAGTTGGGGTTGSGGATGAAGAPSGNQSVLERNKNPSRDGHFIQPALTKAAAATMSRRRRLRGILRRKHVGKSAVHRERPRRHRRLLRGHDRKRRLRARRDDGRGEVDAQHRQLAASDSGVGCGNIHPIGIISTPVIDAASRTIFVAGAIGTQRDHAPRGARAVHRRRHREVRLAGRRVDRSASGGITFMPQPQNQRSALSLVGGTLYVAYGGHVGDCGPYHGWVDRHQRREPDDARRLGDGRAGRGDLGGRRAWRRTATASSRRRATGTAAARPPHQDSEEVVRVTGLGTRADTYYPTMPMNGQTPRWQAMDSADADMASIEPVYMEVPGATPSKIVVAALEGRAPLPARCGRAGRRGRAQGRLHGRGTRHVDPHRAGRVPDRDGLLLRLLDDQQREHVPGRRQRPGGRRGRGSRPRVRPTPSIVWCAPMSSPTTGPIITTTDGTGDAIVWYMSGGRLMGVDGDTGAPIYASATATPARACGSGSRQSLSKDVS